MWQDTQYVQDQLHISSLRDSTSEMFSGRSWIQSNFEIQRSFSMLTVVNNLQLTLVKTRVVTGRRYLHCPARFREYLEGNGKCVLLSQTKKWRMVTTF